MSKITNSKIKITDDIKVNSFKDFSKIISTEEEENFIRECFDKKFDLGFLYRASENDFSALKFH